MTTLKQSYLRLKVLRKDACPFDSADNWRCASLSPSFFGVWLCVERQQLVSLLWRNTEPVTVNSEEEYEVDHIRDSKMFGRTLKYLVCWKGYEEGEDTGSQNRIWSMPLPSWQNLILKIQVHPVQYMRYFTRSYIGNLCFRTPWPTQTLFL